MPFFLNTIFLLIEMLNLKIVQIGLLVKWITLNMEGLFSTKELYYPNHIIFIGKNKKENYKIKERNKYNKSEKKILKKTEK